MFDYVRVEPTEEMEVFARRFGLKLIYSHPLIAEATPSQAIRLIKRKKVIFVNDVSPSLLSLARQEGVALGVLASDVDDANLGKYIEMVRLMRRYRIPIIISSGARQVEEMRSPHDLVCIGVLLGMEPHEAYASLTRRWSLLGLSPDV